MLYCVKWCGFADSENTWEPRASLMENCSALIEEYEAKLKGQPQLAKAPPETIDLATKVTVDNRAEEKAKVVAEAAKPKTKTTKVGKARNQKRNVKATTQEVVDCMELEDPVGTLEMQADFQQPLYDISTLAADKKFRTNKSLTCKTEEEKLVEALTYVDRIEQHMIVDGELYFVCSWVDKVTHFNNNRFLISLAEMEKNNPFVLLAYLKGCLVTQIN